MTTDSRTSSTEADGDSKFAAPVSPSDVENSSAWLNEALNMGNTGLWTILINPQTGVNEMLANSTMLQLLGLEQHPSSQECYTHWFSRIDPAYEANVVAAVEKILTSGQQHEVEYPWNHPIKGRIFVRCGGMATPLSGDDVRICLRGYHQDVTEIYAARSSLRENLSRLETACRIGNLGVFELIPNPETKLELRANETFAEQFGVDLQWPLRKIIATLRRRLVEFIPKDWSRLDRPSRRYLGKHYSMNIRFIHPLRGERHFTIEYEFVGEEGDPIRAVGFTRDFTDTWIHAESLRLAKENAEAASRAKSAFLANMSHEIRTPMNGIIGLTSLMLRMDQSPQQRDYLEKLSDLSRSLLGVLNDILDFSKIEADKLDLEDEPFELHRMLDILGGIVRVKSEEKGLPFIVNASADLPEYLRGDALRLRQVLLNLCDNAIKFTPAQGRVELTVQTVQIKDNVALMQFLVRDEGIGISPEAQSRLFQPFTQADASTTRHFGGTGLGLAICRRLASMMGGDLTLESELGKGSVFRLTVPFKMVQPSEIQALEDAPLADVSGLRVLVAEDNAINREIIVNMLECLGVQSEMALNGAEAVSLFESLPHVDGILMDLQMPIMDGYEATSRIRASSHPHAASVPIVALTANAMRGDAEKSVEAGMNGHITKPVELPELSRVLSGWKTNHEKL